jgi:hypothetical protein
MEPLRVNSPLVTANISLIVVTVGGSCLLADHCCPVPNTLYSIPNPPFADVFFRKLRGGSQSSLIGASDGNFYVLKLANNPQGPNTLFNEAFGSLLSHHLGLPVPEWRPIQVSSSFIEVNPDLHFMLAEGTRAPSTGLHFGSKFVIGSKDAEVYEIVPERWMQRVQNPHFFAGMLLLDIWTENVDRRQALFIEGSANRSLDAMFFDHGHMFRGPHGTKRLKSPHACLYYHRTIYRRAFESGNVEAWLHCIEGLSETELQAMIEGVPLEWRSGVLERDTIELLMRNQQTLRQRAKEVTEELLNDEKMSSSVTDGQNERSIYM